MLSARLQTFLAVIEEQSFTRAAERLSLTQPAVSHHMKQLEEELGVTLFVRGRRKGFSLTPQGEIAAKYARRMSALYEKLRVELENAEKNLTKLRVGITHTAESNLTAQALAKCSGPDLSITILTDSIQNLYDMLENYELDLAIAEGTPGSPMLCSLMLDTDYLVCVLAREHPLAKRAMITLGELKRERMILRLPSSATRRLFEATLNSLNETIGSFNIILEVVNIATIKDLVRKQMGVSILPRSACMDELRKGKIAALPIENLSMVRETRLVYSRDFSNMEILQQIARAYRETARESR